MTSIGDDRRHRDRRARRPGRRRATGSVCGLVYALPTSSSCSVSSSSRWCSSRRCRSQLDAAERRQGINFPKNYVAITNNQLFCPAIFFTLEYTVVVTVLLIGLGSGWRCSCRSGPLGRGAADALPAPGGGRPRDRVAAVLGLLLARDRADQPAPRGIGLIDDPIRSSRRPGARCSRRFPDRLEVRRCSTCSSCSSACRPSRPSVYEAAAHRRRHPWQTFRRITLPLLRPSLALALILCVTGSLLAFDQFYILTKGGPDNTTVTVVQLIYREAFQRQNLGTAAAISLILLARPADPERGPVPGPARRGDGLDGDRLE